MKKLRVFLTVLLTLSIAMSCVVATAFAASTKYYVKTTKTIQPSSSQKWQPEGDTDGFTLTKNATETWYITFDGKGYVIDAGYYDGSYHADIASNKTLSGTVLSSSKKFSRSTAKYKTYIKNRSKVEIDVKSGSTTSYWKLS